MEVYVSFGPGGWSVTWFNPRTERCAYWYGSREDCEARAGGPPPKGLWVPNVDAGRSYSDATRD